MTVPDSRCPPHQLLQDLQIPSCPVFAVDGVVLAGCCGLALVIALAAALLPARRAAHLLVLAACRPR
jgi:hypothetical protein